MTIEIKTPDARPGEPPKNIHKKSVSVYQMFGLGCHELLRFKVSKGGITYIFPFMRNADHISFHPKETHYHSKNRGYSKIDVESFYAAHKLFTKVRSPCICVRIGTKINKSELEKIIPLVVKFLPAIDIEISELIKGLLIRRFFRFRAK